MGIKTLKDSDLAIIAFTKLQDPINPNSDSLISYILANYRTGKVISNVTTQIERLPEIITDAAGPFKRANDSMTNPGLSVACFYQNPLKRVCLVYVYDKSGNNFFVYPAAVNVDSNYLRVMKSLVITKLLYELKGVGGYVDSTSTFTKINKIQIVKDKIFVLGHFNGIDAPVLSECTPLDEGKLLEL